LSQKHSEIALTDFRPLLQETGPELRRALARVFERGRFILDENVAAFEREFAESIGAPYAVGVSSGTSAIEICLRAAGLGDSGREVLTSPLTAPFTGLAILAAGCKPRFADIEPDTLLMSTLEAGSRITTRTAAILPVHLYGQPCDLPALSRLARRSAAVLVQDACQAHGAFWSGRPLTAFSPYVAYSFYPTKNLGCLGDGGAVATSRRSVAAKARLFRDGARDARHVSQTRALNARLDEIQAVFLRVFLTRLGMRNELRRRLAADYEGALEGCDGVTPVAQSDDSVRHLYVVRARRRDLLRKYLAARGVQTGIHYPVPLHLHPAFSSCRAKRGEFPHAEKACSEIVSLPLWPDLPRSSVLRVAELVRAFYR
jgi:dTDP-3-amino-3,4,6-trideoxy-alpha-D-glucose transaminase